MIADLINGPLAHLPSGRLVAYSAWVLCAAITPNLPRAAGATPPSTLIRGSWTDAPTPHGRTQTEITRYGRALQQLTVPGPSADRD